MVVAVLISLGLTADGLHMFANNVYGKLIAKVPLDGGLVQFGLAKVKYIFIFNIVT